MKRIGEDKWKLSCQQQPGKEGEGTMLKEYALNHEESIRVRDIMGAKIEEKGCYTNIFFATEPFMEKFRNKEWRIAYGYMQMLEDAPLLARHCFIVTNEGEAIDPTLVNTSGYTKGEKRLHVSFAEFEDMETYTDAILQNDNRPDLCDYFMKREREVCHPWAQEKNYFLIG